MCQWQERRFQGGRGTWDFQMLLKGQVRYTEKCPLCLETWIPVGSLECMLWGPIKRKKGLEADNFFFFFEKLNREGQRGKNGMCLACPREEVSSNSFFFFKSIQLKK